MISKQNKLIAAVINKQHYSNIRVTNKRFCYITQKMFISYEKNIIIRNYHNKKLYVKYSMRQQNNQMFNYNILCCVKLVYGESSILTYMPGTHKCRSTLDYQVTLVEKHSIRPLRYCLLYSLLNRCLQVFLFSVVLLQLSVRANRVV